MIRDVILNPIAALLLQGVQMLLVLALAPLLLGVTRWIRARMLRRRGPPVIQPYRDLLKLIRKEAVVADNASWLFRAAPYMIFAATWVAAALVPTFAPASAMMTIRSPTQLKARPVAKVGTSAAATQVAAKIM